VRPIVQLPFSIEQFFQVIRAYNLAVWPAQVAFNLLAAAAVALLFVRRRWTSRLICAILAALWVWIAVAYHLAFFSAINPAAYVFAALFLVGAAAFAWGAVRDRHRFAATRSVDAAVGAALLAYALVVYPAWATASGHAYPDLPTFGLPCPTTIFSIAMLAFVVHGRARLLLVAPIVWSAIGLQAAFVLAVVPDIGLGVAGLFGVWLALRPVRRQRIDASHASVA